MNRTSSAPLLAGMKITVTEQSRLGTVDFDALGFGLGEIEDTHGWNHIVTIQETQK